MTLRRAGRRRALSAEASVPKDSHLRILRMIRRIPLGRVSTYGEIARLAGLPGRARLVGTVLRICPLADGVPWYRVVNAAGRISERGGGGPREQSRRLVAEGVESDSRGRINLEVFGWP